MSDVITRDAAKLFNVPEAEVTPTQRQVTKQWRHGTNYASGVVKMSLLVGMYPIKVEPSNV